MSQILTILRAAHCRSTHHYFALDALRHINTDAGGRLADLLLKHYDRYLKGAKDPDAKFRDFQNHVLHVSDNHWGGAPRACEKWLKTAINHLNNEEWEDAAYDLGVLSHYFTDPLMPLHTGSSDTEGIVHRPMEWSICKSYEEIYQRWASGRVRVRFTLPESERWISDAVTAGASASHRYYHRLIEIYDLPRGVRSPPEGLTAEARDILAEMFGIAITGWARILERVAEQATSRIPVAGLSVATVVAAIDFPFAWVLKKIASAQEKAAVKAIFNEYQTTGTVRVHLPSEVRTVRTELAMSVNSRSVSSKPTVKNEQPAPITESVKTPVVDAPSEQSPAAVPPQQDAIHEPVVTPTQVSPSEESANTKRPAWAPASLSMSPPKDSNRAGEAIPSTEHAPTTEGLVADDASTRNTFVIRTPSVSVSSDLEDAPSIGPKTAQRFANIGVLTIGDFLSSKPSTMAEKLQTRWITEELIRDWQAQAQLVCDLATLCGYKSQLLVALEVRCREQLAHQDPDRLAQRIAEYCETKAGQRILRSSSVPERADVASWIAEAANSRKRAA
ncbi:MAG: DUF4332 domain-containing protein [Pirellulaceae bacterium]